jgi:hypothetical protein
VHNVLVRHSYRPVQLRPPAAGPSLDDLSRALVEGELSFADATRVYATIVCARSQSYAEAGRRLGWDWRTVAAKVDRELLARLTEGRWGETGRGAGAAAGRPKRPRARGTKG